MEVLKFSDFLTEAKKHEKSVLISTLIKFLTDKPEVKFNSKTYPDEKGAYSLAGIKKHFKSLGMTDAEADDAMHHAKNDKEVKKQSKIESFSIKNYSHKVDVVYYFIGLSDKEVMDIKELYKKESMNRAKPEIEKKAQLTKKKIEASKSRTTERKTPAKPRARKSKS